MWGIIAVFVLACLWLSAEHKVEVLRREKESDRS